MAYNQQPLRILVVGNSLTAGYFNHGQNYHPYTNHLSDLFASAKIPVIIHNQGLSGERVVPFMVQRFETLLTKSNHSPCHWVMILGGTNDLGYNSSAKRIFDEGLKPMYNMALHHGYSQTKLVVMTVLENGLFLPNDPRDKERQALNEMIKNYAMNYKNKDSVCLIDLDKGIPYYHRNNSDKQELIWDDKVHLKPAGYNLMATLVFEGIKDELQEKKNEPRPLRYWRTLIYIGVFFCTLILLRRIWTYFHVSL